MSHRYLAVLELLISTSSSTALSICNTTKAATMQQTTDICRRLDFLLFHKFNCPHFIVDCRCCIQTQRDLRVPDTTGVDNRNPTQQHAPFLPRCSAVASPENDSWFSCSGQRPQLCIRIRITRCIVLLVPACRPVLKSYTQAGYRVTNVCQVVVVSQHLQRSVRKG